MSDNNDMREAKDLAWKAFCEAPTSRDLGRSKVDAAVAAALEWQSQQAQGEVVAYYDPRPGVDWECRFLEPDVIEQEDNRKFYTVPLIANQLAPVASPEHEGDICDKCKRAYSCVHNVPNDVWAKIAPRPETLGEHNYGGGLLCPDCAATAAKEIGVHLIFAGEQWEEFPNPPPAEVPEAVKAAFEVLDRSYYRTWRRDFERGDRSPTYVCGDVNATAITEIIEWARKPALCDTRRPTAPAAVPDGWKLVPTEPTPDMTLQGALSGVSHAGGKFSQQGAEAVYKAMLAASPKPTQPDNQ